MFSFNENAFWGSVLVSSWPMHHDRFLDDPETPQGKRLLRPFREKSSVFPEDYFSESQYLSQPAIAGPSCRQYLNTQRNSGNGHTEVYQAGKQHQADRTVLRPCSCFQNPSQFSSLDQQVTPAALFGRTLSGPFSPQGSTFFAPFERSKFE